MRIHRRPGAPEGDLATTPRPTDHSCCPNPALPPSLDPPALPPAPRSLASDRARRIVSPFPTDPSPAASLARMASPQPTPAPALPELEGLLRLSSKRTHSLYLASSSFSLPADPVSTAAGQRSKIADEYRDSVVLPPSLAGAGAKRAKVESGPAKAGRLLLEGGSAAGGATTNGRAAEAGPSQELVSYRHSQGLNAEGGANQSRLSKELMRRKEAREVVPEYHPQCTSTSIYLPHAACPEVFAATGADVSVAPRPRSGRPSSPCAGLAPRLTPRYFRAPLSLQGSSRVSSRATSAGFGPSPSSRETSGLRPAPATGSSRSGTWPRAS